MSDEISLAPKDASADESSRSSASGVRRSGRSQKRKVTFDEEPSAAPGKRKEKHGEGKDSPSSAPASSAADDASSQSAASPVKQARARMETKNSLCVYRNWEQSPVVATDASGEASQEYLPWALTVKKCDALTLKKVSSGEKLPIKAGDTISLYSAKKPERQRPYTVCWFELEEGQNAWKVYAVDPANSDHSVRLPVADIVKHVSADPKTTANLRNSVWADLAGDNKAALGAVDDKKRKRSKAARQYAARHTSYLPDGGSAADLGDALTKAQKLVEQLDKLLVSTQTLHDRLRDALEAVKLHDVQYARRMDDFDALYRVAVSASISAAPRR